MNCCVHSKYDYVHNILNHSIPAIILVKRAAIGFFSVSSRRVYDRLHTHGSMPCTLFIHCAVCTLEMRTQTIRRTHMHTYERVVKELLVFVTCGSF